MGTSSEAICEKKETRADQRREHTQKRDEEKLFGHELRYTLLGRPLLNRTISETLRRPFG